MLKLKLQYFGHLMSRVDLLEKTLMLGGSGRRRRRGRPRMRWLDGITARPFRYDLNLIHYDYTVEVRNRFKELDLIDRVPDELWNEVRDTVQDTVIKTIPMEKKWKKAKWLLGEALQIAVKRREAKSKGEKERYKHLNAEFQRETRRDKKAINAKK